MNCHAILFIIKPIYSIEELSALLKATRHSFNPPVTLSIPGFCKRPIEGQDHPHPLSISTWRNVMESTQKITPCLWFDDQAEEAAEFYTGIFRNSKILNISRYGEAGHEIHGKPAGTVMTVTFKLEGQAFTALNGGPSFKFNEAISFQVDCETQEEVDYYWEKLSEGGDEKAQQCGWLKDKYGVSWQIVPGVLLKMLNDPNSEKSQRTMEAMLRMKKIDIAELKRASGG
ncbi:VOC family protein [Nitrosovibrio sp. Nv6]|uniref:VOC family protein n=1 Tax=Nitrosovibrio sp. Nv6 TaxID=1855340 RepID=UPI0021016C1A|nr:VOC family protein [Nitrosovibrio sp. Nv6]